MKRDPRIVRVTADDDGDGFPSNIRIQYEREAGTGSIILVTRKGYEYYRARFWVTDDLGVRRAKYVYAKTYADAEKKMRFKLRADSNEIGAKTTVSKYMRGWLDQVKADNRLSTWRLYESTFRNHVEPYIGKVKFKALTARNVNELLKTLSAASVGDRTRQNVRKVLHAAYRSATDMGLITRNPISAVRPPKAADREQVILSQDEATRLLVAARQTHWYALVLLALVSGMREGELLALTVADLRLDDIHPHLLVNKTLTEAEDGALVRTEPKTKASKRRVDLDRETANVLREKIDGLGKSDHVFTTADGSLVRKSNFLRRVWHPMLDSAGLPRVTFHSIRHVVNTLLLAGGSASHLDLAARLGHSSPRMTLERYARVVPGAQAQIAVVARGFFEVQLDKCGATGGAIDSDEADSTDP